MLAHERQIESSRAALFADEIVRELGFFKLTQLKTARLDAVCDGLSRILGSMGDRTAFLPLLGNERSFMSSPQTLAAFSSALRVAEQAGSNGAGTAGRLLDDVRRVRSATTVDSVTQAAIDELRTVFDTLAEICTQQMRPPEAVVCPPGGARPW
jgi:hypothetical protein